MDLKYKKMFAQSSMDAESKEYKFKELDKTLLTFTDFITKVQMIESIKEIKMKRWYFLVLAQAHKNAVTVDHEILENSMSINGIPIVVDNDISFTVDLVFNKPFARRELP